MQSPNSFFGEIMSLVIPLSRCLYNATRLHRIKTIPEKLLSIFVENKCEITAFFNQAELALENISISDCSSNQTSSLIKQLHTHRKIIKTLKIMRCHYSQLIKDVSHIRAFFEEQRNFDHEDNVRATLKKYDEAISQFNIAFNQNALHTIKNIMECDYVNFILDLKLDSSFNKWLYNF